MFPDADVPVVELSVHAGKPFDEHLALGAALSPLRDEGVMVIASGNVVHNLSMVDWQSPGTGAPWAQSFDDAVRRTMTTEPSSLGLVVDDPGFHLAVPTPDHFLPLAYLAGLATASGERASTIVDGLELGSLSMTSYAIGG
jgi:4,5-DOPA dioxygenase extradiol